MEDAREPTPGSIPITILDNETLVMSINLNLSEYLVSISSSLFSAFVGGK